MILALILLTTTSSGHAVDDHRGTFTPCGFVDSTEEERRIIERDTADYHAVHGSPKNLVSPDDVITVDVYWHVITKSDGTGDYSDDKVERVLRILNKAFHGEESNYQECGVDSFVGLFSLFDYEDFPASPFVFRLRAVTREAHDAAFVLDSNASSEYRAARRTVGDCAALHVFTGDSDRFLGVARKPVYCPYGGHPEFPNPRDSIAVTYQSLPSGGHPFHSEGDTVVHEVGHWLGLEHPWGSCRNGGSCSSAECSDDVDDTAPAREEVTDCPITRNSCGSEADNNFMDYTWDCCKYRFTQGQIDRMVLHAKMYRGLEPEQPSKAPTTTPSTIPTIRHSALPSVEPSDMPTHTHSVFPTNIPSTIPTDNPTLSITPSKIPSSLPSLYPSTIPSSKPSVVPTVLPSDVPSILPTVTFNPTLSLVPSTEPSPFPTSVPTTSPTLEPSSRPSTSPSTLPSNEPTRSSVPTISSVPTVSFAPSVQGDTFYDLLVDLYDLTSDLVELTTEILSGLFDILTEDQFVAALKDLLAGAYDIFASYVTALVHLSADAWHESVALVENSTLVAMLEELPLPEPTEVADGVRNRVRSVLDEVRDRLQNVTSFPLDDVSWFFADVYELVVVVSEYLVGDMFDNGNNNNTTMK